MALLKNGYTQCQSDHILFVKQGRKKTYSFDCLWWWHSGYENDELQVKLKAKLVKEFEIKYLGQLRYFLGIEVARSKNDIFLSQWKYVLNLLKATGMLGCKPAMVPIDPNHRIKENLDDHLIDAGKYQS